MEVTVATVSTILYQYDNTAVTSYRTIQADITGSLPTGSFQESSISGVPTDLLPLTAGPYFGLSTLIFGTEITDPYGIVYTSPTPVWIINDVQYFTAAPTATASGYACPEEYDGNPFDVLEAYPSGACR